MPDKTLSQKLGRQMRRVGIVGTGSYVPDKILSNEDLAGLVDTSDEWIVTRTGIKERRIAADGQATSDLAAEAAKRALEQAEVSPGEIDLIIVATISADMFFPSTSCLVQRKLQATKAVCFDLSAACSGFLYGIEVAQQFLTTHAFETALIIGAEKLSSMVDWKDRNTCVLFGDGAAAAVLQTNSSHAGALIASHMGSDGNLTDILSVPGGGSACPIKPENAGDSLNTIKMQGREVYKYAVTAMRRAAEQVLEKANLTINDIALLIPHQANLRIIEAIAERLGAPKEKVFVNLHKYGNTSAAAVAIALDEANRSGAIKRGDYILLVAFGAGLTWAATIIQW